MAKRENRLKTMTDELGTFGIINMRPAVNNLDFTDKQTEKSNVVDLGIYKLYNGVELPEYATYRSGCFDVKVYLGSEIESVKVVDRLLNQYQRKPVSIVDRDNVTGVIIYPDEVIMIPTGLVFDIPDNYKLLFYPRSGTSINRHIVLSNAVGYIDEDYVLQTYLLMKNTSEVRQYILHGERLAQCEIVPVHRANFVELENPPTQKTNRDGGVGSTGLN